MSTMQPMGTSIVDRMRYYHLRLPVIRFPVKEFMAFEPDGVFVIDDKITMRYALIPLDPRYRRITGKLVQREAWRTERTEDAAP